MLCRNVFALALMIFLVGCNKDANDVSASKHAAHEDEPAILLSAEDLLLVQRDSYSLGPVITGAIQPAQRADLRAEMNAVVTQVLKESGEPVRHGDLLLRLDDTSIRDSLGSAEESARASSQAFDQADRQLQRQKTLRASGMASIQQLEEAQIRRNNAQSELAAARAHVVQARQQLQRTEVRAPFDGIVSERRVSVGDTVQIGAELLKVVNPNSMRFEGFVSADEVRNVKAGHIVHFRIHGYENQEFLGHVMRVDPSANAMTRQVSVLISFTQNDQPNIAGLYAEGRIETNTSKDLVIPESALVHQGHSAYAWLVKKGELLKIKLVLRDRDQRRGGYFVESGLSDGDSIIRNPVPTLKSGQRVEITALPVARGTTTGSMTRDVFTEGK